MSKTDLKAALESLQVKKPLRLPSSAPSFKAPVASTSVGISSQDKNSSLVPSLAQDANSPTDATENPKVIATPSPTLGQNSSQDANHSQDAMRSLVTNQSQSGFSSEELKSSSDSTESMAQIPPVVARSTQARRATEQDRAVTEVASLKSRLSTGYTRVPNSILMEMVSGDLSRNEMKILLLVARMTVSFNRRYVPLSKSVIERMTGIQGRAVLEAVQSLQNAGFLEKLPGNHKSPNRLGLSQEAFQVFDSKEGAKQSEDTFGSPDERSTERLDKRSTYKKENSETIGLRKKISLSGMSEGLRQYFSELKPRRKREAEFGAFEELSTDYSAEQVEACLNYLTKNGLPNNGAPCHSPMSYLAKAMSQVLPEVQAIAERKLRHESHVAAVAAQKNKLVAEQIEAQEASAQRESAFLAAFPNPEDQDAIIEKYSSQFPMLRKGSLVLRGLAITAWWEDKTGG